MREKPDHGSGGLVIGLAIGAALTLAYAWVVTGGALSTWPLPAFLFQFLFISAPFGLVALIGSRDWRAWAAAFAFTALLWGPFLYIGYRWHWS
ncbi:MAG TPA: hypothetical protein VF574_11385 [Allosphingosinicella sp.]|jgi:hypothetical protein